MSRSPDRPPEGTGATASGGHTRLAPRLARPATRAGGVPPRAVPDPPPGDVAPSRPRRADAPPPAIRLRAEHLDAVVDNAAVSFGRPQDESAWEQWRDRLERGEVYGIVDDDVVIGQARLVPTYHRFGRRPVAALDLASVAVPPQHRGKGVASALTLDAAAIGTASGFGLSVLFPATTSLYRRLGWEHAGSLTRYRVRTRALPTRGPRLRPADQATDGPAIERCRERAVGAIPGVAVRPPERWDAFDDADYRYVLDDPTQRGEVAAYALVDHERDPDDWQFRYRLRDWAATTREGLEAIAALVGSSASFARYAMFTDAWPSRWSQLLPEQDLEVVGGLHWMARGLDLPSAIASRGFPTGLALAVTLRIDDEPALEGAVPTGPWRLEVAGGAGHLTEVPGADVRLAALAVGPLYTGFRSATELSALGLLRGPTEALELLDAAFAGPPPTLLDFF